MVYSVIAGPSTFSELGILAADGDDVTGSTLDTAVDARSLRHWSITLSICFASAKLWPCAGNAAADSGSTPSLKAVERID